MFCFAIPAPVHPLSWIVRETISEAVPVASNPLSTIVRGTMTSAEPAAVNPTKLIVRWLGLTRLLTTLKGCP